MLDSLDKIVDGEKMILNHFGTRPTPLTFDLSPLNQHSGERQGNSKANGWFSMKLALDNYESHRMNTEVSPLLQQRCKLNIIQGWISNLSNYFIVTQQSMFVLAPANVLNAFPLQS